MIIRFIGKKPELDRYSVKYHAGGENRLHFEMPVPYNNGSEYRIFLNGADVTDGFDYSTVSYVHAPVVVKRGGQTIWTSSEIWLDVVRKEDDFGGGGAMVDATLTVQGAAADAKATGDAISELSKEKVNLPKDEDGNIDNGSIGLYAVSDGKGGIMWEQVSDEELLKKGLELTPDSGLMVGYVWTASSTDKPVADAKKFCTRKLKVSRLPILVAGLPGPWAYTLWRSGKNVGEIAYTAAEEAGFNTDIVFDEVAVSYGYGATREDLSVTFQIFDGEQFAFKKVLVMGDSISVDYYGEYTKWVTMLIDDGFFPAQSTTNDSIHATGFVARYNNKANDFLTRIEAITDKSTYDLVVVFGGINDFIHSIPLGESGDDKTTHFKPAVDYFFEYLVNNFTQARIVVLSPLRTYNIHPNQAGSKQTEYAAYIREVAKGYCLPVLNLTEESGFFPFNEAFKHMWTFTGWSGGDGTKGDGVHPSEEYIRKFLAPMIKGFLMSIKPK